MDSPRYSLPAPENGANSTSARSQAASLPGLAAALRSADASTITVAPNRPFTTAELVPMYRIDEGDTVGEIEGALQVVDHVLERIRRLAGAYGEWAQFDTGAYFDLTEEQVKLLVRVVERVNTVHVVFYTDLLLPTFRAAGRAWRDRFLPAYAQAQHMLDHGYDTLVSTSGFYQEVQPAMVGIWEQTYDTIGAVRERLAHDMGYMAANGAQEERHRWRHFWRTLPNRGLDDRLLPDWSTIPTLTLAVEFPLPTHRQSGRVRRLRRNRDRRRSLRR